MAKKDPPPASGIPDWFLTYCDTMTLLLCFFILLYAFSSDTPKKFDEVRGSLDITFGIPIVKRVVRQGRHEDDLSIRIKERMEEVSGPLIDEGGGFHVLVESLREGTLLRLGGGVPFDQGSDQLRGDVIPTLDALSKLIHETRNHVEVRGHTSGESDDAASGDLGKWDLSWRRARTVMEYLVGKGEPAGRFSTAGYSRFDPLSGNFVEEGQRELNRRIELLVKPIEKVR